jgi:hypothetical protein
MSVFLSFFLLFSSTKSENRSGIGPAQEVGRNKWEVVGKGDRRVNMVQKLYMCT